jgi:putative hemolysin
MGITELLIIAGMLVLNGLFAAYELALASVKLPRLQDLAAARHRGAASAVRMKDRMEASLAVVQLGITLVGAIAAATGGANVEEDLVPWFVDRWGMREPLAEFIALALFVIPLAAVTIVAGELVPKIFAIRNPEKVCLWLSPAMSLFAAVVFPAVWCFESATRMILKVVDRILPKGNDDGSAASLNEFRSQVSMMRASRLIGPQQEQIMVEASRLSSLRVHQIMVDAADIVMLEADAPLTQSIVQAHLDLHTRFPVTQQRGSAQHIVGYVNIKEMFFLAKTHPHNPTLRQIIRPLISFDPQTTVSDALARMVAAHVHLALVRKPDATVVGMLTQEDIFEVLVGDIEDEFDRLPRYLVPSGFQWIAAGGVTLGKLRQEMSRPDLAPGLSPDTSLHDWLANDLSRVFKGGDTITRDGLHILVRKVRRQKIAEVLIEQRSPGA